MSRISVEVRLEGIVQGVGFRPFVYALAVRLGLAGYVRNDSSGVTVEVEGEPERIARFLANHPRCCERWKHMSPEQRQKLIQRIHERRECLGQKLKEMSPEQRKAFLQERRDKRAEFRKNHPDCCPPGHDRREDARDHREDRRDKAEDRGDRREDRRDKAEDMRDERHDGGPRDRAEDRRDAREDHRDSTEDKRDKREDRRDGKEGERDRKHGPSRRR